MSIFNRKKEEKVVCHEVQLNYLKKESKELFDKVNDVLEIILKTTCGKCEQCPKQDQSADYSNEEELNNQVVALKSQLDELKYELIKKEQLKDEIVLLKKELDEVHKKSAAENQKNNDEETNRLETELTQAKQIIDDLKSEKSLLQANLKELEIDFAKLEKSVIKKDQTLKSYEKEIKDLKNERDQLLKQSKNAESKPDNKLPTKELEETRQAKNELETKLREREREIKNLQKQIETLKSNEAKLKKDSSNVDKDLEKRNSELQQMIEKNRKQIEKQKKAIKEQDEFLDKYEKDLDIKDERIKELENEQSKTQSAISESEKAKKELEKQKAELEQQLKDLEDKMNMAQNKSNAASIVSERTSSSLDDKKNKANNELEDSYKSITLYQPAYKPPEETGRRPVRQSVSFRVDRSQNKFNFERSLPLKSKPNKYDSRISYESDNYYNNWKKTSHRFDTTILCTNLCCSKKPNYCRTDECRQSSAVLSHHPLELFCLHCGRPMAQNQSPPTKDYSSPIHRHESEMPPRTIGTCKSATISVNSSSSLPSTLLCSCDKCRDHNFTMLMSKKV